MKYVVWFLGLLAIIIVVIFGVIITRNIIRGFNTNSTRETTTVSVRSDDIENTVVEYIVEGPVAANENFRSFTIKISDSSRVAVTRSGYNNTPIGQIDLTNNLTAFTDFSAALDNAGFGTAQRSRNDDPASGRCSSGRFYRMNITKNNELVSSLWTDACTGIRSGTFGGNLSSVNTLFTLQVPGFNQLLNQMGGTF
jgi:hypothetical protein